MTKTLDQLCAELELLFYRKGVISDSICQKQEEIADIYKEIDAKQKQIDEAKND